MAYPFPDVTPSDFMNRTDWVTALLNRLQVPMTPQNRASLKYWQGWEGGGTKNAADYNPLNTTWGRNEYPTINSHGVVAYPDYETGIASTVKTLQQPYYPDIMSGLRAGTGIDLRSPQVLEQLAKWGTHTMPEVAAYLKNHTVGGAGTSPGWRDAGASWTDARSLAEQAAPEQAVAAMGQKAPTPALQLDGQGTGVISALIKRLEEARQQDLAALMKDMQAQQAQVAGIMGQMQGLANAPAPQNSPWAEFSANLMGGISQALAPQMGGQQLAQQTTQEPLDQVSRQRTANMQLLAQKYQQAASRAEKMGDMEGSLKYTQNYDRVSKELQARLEMDKHKNPGLEALQKAHAERIESMVKEVGTLQTQLPKLKGSKVREVQLRINRLKTNISELQQQQAQGIASGNTYQMSVDPAIDSLAELLKSSASKYSSLGEMLKAANGNGPLKERLLQYGISLGEFRAVAGQVWQQLHPGEGPGAEPKGKRLGGAAGAITSGGGATKEAAQILWGTAKKGAVGSDYVSPEEEALMRKEWEKIHGLFNYWMLPRH